MFFNRIEENFDFEDSIKISGKFYYLFTKIGSNNRSNSKKRGVFQKAKGAMDKEVNNVIKL